MTKSMRTFGSLVVTVALAVPALAEAQAIPRAGGSSSSGSSSGGGGGGSSSSGGSSSGSSSSSGASGGASVRSPSGQPASGGEFRSRESDSSRRGGTARPGPVPGAVVVGGGESAGTRSRAGEQTTGATDAFGRSRGGRPVSGTAVARTARSGDFVSFPFFGPWGNWYPWATGFGWNFGYMTYNPWAYGATRWYWSPYGLWYDPYGYYWDPYWDSHSGRAAVKEREPEKTTGSLRIKSNVSNAKVYIDNALVGLVDEFDGLKDHLEVEGGRHVLELRADGYQSFTQEVNVKIDRTLTVRGNLKKVK